MYSTQRMVRKCLLITFSYLEKGAKYNFNFTNNVLVSKNGVKYNSCE